MPSISNRNPRLPTLVANFGHFVHVFETNPAFTRAGQLESHLATIRLRRQLGSVTAALADESFIRNLHRTLQAWGIGARASNLANETDFAAALRSKTSELAALEALHIDDTSLNPNATAQQLWRVISSLGIVSNNSTVVDGSKALHHILPELVPRPKRVSHSQSGADCASITDLLSCGDGLHDHILQRGCSG
jgi:hypothetical protein